MKKIFLIQICVMLATGSVFAQQTAKFGLYQDNAFVINPAYTGTSGNSQAFMQFRNEITGLRGAPVSRIISADTKVEKWKVGFGINAFEDNTNILARKGLNMTYSYQLAMPNDQRLNFGLSVGAIINYIDYNSIIAENPNELITMYNYKPSTSFNGSFGMMYGIKSFEIGFALTNLFNRTQFSDKYDLKYVQNPEYNATMLYRFDVNENIKNTTSLILRSSQGLPMRFDVRSIFTMKKVVWGGLTYGLNSSFGVCVGLNYNNLKIGYLYEYPLSEISRISMGANEVMIGYTFGKKK